MDRRTVVIAFSAFLTGALIVAIWPLAGPPLVELGPYELPIFTAAVPTTTTSSGGSDSGATASCPLPRPSPDADSLVRQPSEPVCAHIRPVDEACPRFLVHHTTPYMGLGHRISEQLFAWHAATEHNLTYVAPDSDEFADPRESRIPGRDTTYVWAYHLYGVAAGETITARALATRYPNLKKVSGCPYEGLNSPENRALCNVLFESKSFKCCKGNCFLVSAGLFEEHKECLRWKASQGRLLPPATVNVVWHLRTGEFDLHANDTAFFERVKATVHTALEGLPVAHVVVYEARDGEPLPPDFASLNHILNKPTLWPSMSPHISLMVMQAADVLVSTGSSYAELAVLVSDAADVPVFFHHIPKHTAGSGRIDTSGLSEIMSDSIVVFRDGSTALVMDEVRTRTLSRLCPRLAHRPLPWPIEACSTTSSVSNSSVGNGL